MKDTDSRAPAFRARHGADCVELDALPPSELRQRLRRAIQAKIDRTAWKRMVAVERAEQETTRRIAAAWRSLPEKRSSEVTT